MPNKSLPLVKKYSSPKVQRVDAKDIETDKKSGKVTTLDTEKKFQLQKEQTMIIQNYLAGL